jgi:hypothetical protein
MDTLVTSPQLKDDSPTTINSTPTQSITQPPQESELFPIKRKYDTMYADLLKFNQNMLKTPALVTEETKKRKPNTHELCSKSFYDTNFFATILPDQGQRSQLARKETRRKTS